MNDTQLFLCIGVPTFAVLLAWVSNRSDFAALRAEMITLRRELNQDMAALRRDLSQDMTAFRNQMYGEMVELHERVVKVEMKQENR